MYKKLRDVTFGLIFIFLCIDAIPAEISANVNKMTVVTGVAEEFCSAEMTGEMERRSKIVHLSPRRYAVEKKSRFPYAVGSIVFGHESVSVIKGCAIAGVEISGGNRAHATVEYDQAANIREFSDKVIDASIIMEVEGRTQSILDIRLIDGQWMVFDPPLPKIGLRATIKFLREELAMKKPAYFARQAQYTVDQLEKLSQKR